MNESVDVPAGGVVEAVSNRNRVSTSVASPVPATATPRLTMTLYVVAGASGASGTNATTRPCSSNRPGVAGTMREVGGGVRHTVLVERDLDPGVDGDVGGLVLGQGRHDA